MAGKVRNIDLAVDKDGNSRGFAVIEYDHPVEAVQVTATPSLNFQMIYLFIDDKYQSMSERDIESHCSFIDSLWFVAG